MNRASRLVKLISALVLFCILPSSFFLCHAYVWITKDYSETHTNGTVRNMRIAYPDDYTYVRGILFSPNASSTDSRNHYLAAQYKEWLRNNQFAYVGTEGLAQPTPGAGTLVPNIFSNALVSFATQTGRAEITNAPWALVTFSAGGIAGYNVQKSFPEMVIGHADTSGSFGGTPPAGPASVLDHPLFMIASQNDASGVTNQMQGFIALNRPSGLRGSYTVIQGATHSDGWNQYAPAMAHLQRAVDLQYPANQCVLNGKITLNRVAESAGWLVDPATIRNVFPTVTNYAAYTGVKSNAYWLLNQDMAYVYRSFASHNNLIMLAGPSSASEVNPGANIPIAVDVSQFSGWTSLTFYNWSTVLGTVTSGNPPSFTYSNAASGTYLFHVRGMRGGTNVTTRPALVYARKVAAPNIACNTVTNWYAAPMDATPPGLPGNTGTIGSPWDLRTALYKTNTIHPGSILNLRGGIYHTNTPEGFAPGGFAGWIYRSHLKGDSISVPVIIQSYPGELARIDVGAIGGAYASFATDRAALAIGDANTQNGRYSIIRNIEIFSSSTESRLSGNDNPFPPDKLRGDGLKVWGPGVKIINCTIHDTGTGITSFGTGAVGQEYYGNLVYNNGWQGTPHQHGHGIYTQGPNNAGGALKVFARNILAGNYDKNGQFYGSASDGGAEISHYRIYENIFIGMQGQRGGMLLGTRDGGNPNRLQDDQFYDNFGVNADAKFYYHADEDVYTDIRITGNYFANTYWEMSSWQSAVLTNNTLFGVTSYGKVISVVTNASFLPWTFDRNEYYIPGMSTPFLVDTIGGAFHTFPSWKSKTGYDLNSVTRPTLPTTNYVILQNNVYDVNRATVLVYNWTLATNVTVNVSTLGWANGDGWTARNAQNPYADFHTNVLAGQTINLDMQASSHTVAVPYGAPAPIITETFPNFGCFILTREASGAAPPPPPATFVLTVNSSNPASGADIGLSPADNNGFSSGTTAFTRTYNQNVIVSLVSPVTLPTGHLFDKWQRNGVDYSTSIAVTVTNTTTTTMTAFYLTPPPPPTTTAIRTSTSRRRVGR